VENKIAAIWARVSSLGQAEISPEGQVERVKAKLENLGYTAQYTFKVVWTSTDLAPCPEFQQLRRLIQEKKIQAVGMLDRDRIEAHGLQRLNFLADCKEKGVEPIVYQGVPFLDGPEGQLVELALALAKEKQVERAQTGAKQGLSDRAKLKNLPPTTTKAYGYEWQDGKFIPDENCDNAYLIWELALQGRMLKSICRELFSRGIPTSMGKVFWQASSVRAILANPIYAGRIGTLRYEKVEPKHRRKNTFGKTSFTVKPIEQWHFLDGLVEQPIVTWEQYLAVQERLKRNKRYYGGNRKRNYLLRGLIQCQVCGRKYFGVQGTRQRPVYVCSAAWGQTYGKRCPSKSIPCSKIEEDVKAKVRNFLEDPGIYLGEIDGRCEITEKTVADIERAINDNEKEYQKTIEDERYALKMLTEVAFGQEQVLIQARRIWLEKENQELRIKLANLQKFSISQEMMEKMKESLQERLDRATDDDWRFILESLNTKVMAFSDRTSDIEINIPTLVDNKISCCIFPLRRPGIHRFLTGYQRYAPPLKMIPPPIRILP